MKPVFVFIIFAVLLGEIGKVGNVAYNSTLPTGHFAHWSFLL